MQKFLLFTIAVTAFFLSCKTEPPRPVLSLPLPTENEIAPREFDIIDHKNNSKGETIPEWVSQWLGRGNRGVETLNSFQSSFAFVHSNEGTNFRALELWKDNFSAEQDFPRLAAKRIEARFSRGVFFPDEEYGTFFGALIRSASDMHWTGASTIDDFWIQKKYHGENDDENSLQNILYNNLIDEDGESWEFLVLVTIEKSSFTSQLETIFENISPIPSPSQEQMSAAHQVQEFFYDGF